MGWTSESCTVKVHVSFQVILLKRDLWRPFRILISISVAILSLIFPGTGCHAHERWAGMARADFRQVSWFGENRRRTSSPCPPLTALGGRILTLHLHHWPYCGPVPSSSCSNRPTTTPLTTVTGAYALVAPLSGWVQSSFGYIGYGPEFPSFTRSSTAYYQSKSNNCLIKKNEGEAPTPGSYSITVEVFLRKRRWRAFPRTIWLLNPPLPSSMVLSTPHPSLPPCLPLSLPIFLNFSLPPSLYRLLPPFESLFPSLPHLSLFPFLPPSVLCLSWFNSVPG